MKIRSHAVTILGTFLQLATSAQTAPPSRDWRPREKEFNALVDRRPFPETTKARLVEMLRQENLLIDALLDEGTGPSDALGEGYSMGYVSELTSEVFRLVKEGYGPGLPALIRAPYGAYSVIGEYLGKEKWRECVPYFLSLDPARAQGIRFASGVEMLGLICRFHCKDMERNQRLQVETRLVQALSDPSVGIRMAALDAVVDAGLKAAIPTLREMAAKAPPTQGLGDISLERNAALKALKKLEQLP